ncbi:2-phosphosulfolactate phosphatase [Kitasatospora sp. MAA4]|uniref:2-phosphosulfolactate phosphatase n=1 Tax=Kitasatospora sp. MAA4 TaxID=3035093 RepID=UPI0024733E0C|nr:2-phosphosulfolactate phosphatase [Kitasatospora sp. MAA4]MDH6136153.1 2-phosphosulfolactate phosphatase [Kitasatospora sp. MAA4]
MAIAVDDWYVQTGSGARFDWGPVGAQRLAADVACLVVVDVLSFTTSVTVAVESGTRVFPYAWHDESAVKFADAMDARLAAGRRAATSDSPWSLSPAALRSAPFTPRLVLPSPNGSSIAAAAGASVVVAGCLRNATAVGNWLAQQAYGTPERPVAVIAAGERWPDGSLRPALEDLLGAGAVLAALRKQGGGSMSAEAAAAVACYEATPDVAAAVADSASGRELAYGGFGEDVGIASELDVCGVVPVLVDGAFTAADRPFRSRQP